jgi:hypothetical protein
MTNRQAAILVTVGGLLVAVGSLLPWITLTSGFGSASVAGIEGDGILTLILGGVIALLGFLAYGGTGPRFVTFLLSVGALAFGGWELVTLSGKLSSTDTARVAVGMGLYIVVGGAVVALIGSVMRRPVTSDAS